ncbi:hypothetical protein BJX70DRAFT_357360 [Aspergillus crustosus]
MGLTDDEKFQKALRELDHNGLFITPEIVRKLIAGEKLTEEEAPGTTTKAPKPTTTRKRKAPDAPPAPLTEIDDDDPILDEIKWDCDQIRRKITSLIASKAMMVSEFQREAKISSKAYYAFMKQSGKSTGQGSSVYSGAHRFFRKRELLGIKEARAAPPVSKKAKLEMEQLYDVSSIRLDGEEEGDVPVFDTCDIVRAKIRTFLRKSGMPKSTFCREISKTFVDRDTPLQTGPLNAFLAKKGAKDGNQSLTFYAAYVFFEKLRIRDGEPETEFRLEMEDIWPGGFDRVNPAKQRFIIPAGWALYTDKYGQVQSIRG